MAIQAINSTMPSFGAKLRNNEESTNLLNNMNKLELHLYDQALKKLENHNENDVLEIRKEQDETGSGNLKYSIVNLSNEDNKLDIIPKIFQSVEFCIIQGLNEASKIGSEAYNKLFNHNNEKEGEQSKEDLALIG